MVLPSDASVLSHVFWKYFRKFLNQQAFKFLRRKNTRSACFSGDPSPELKPTAAEPRARGSPCPRGAVGSAPGGAPPTQQGAAETAVRPQPRHSRAAREGEVHSNAASSLRPPTTKSQPHGWRGLLHTAQESSHNVYLSNY